LVGGAFGISSLVSEYTKPTVIKRIAVKVFINRIFIGFVKEIIEFCPKIAI
jgi:hypothetical protein